MITVIGPKDKNFDTTGKQFFNVTSHSNDFCKELSPFFLGPCELYNGYISKKMENAWQYSKVYECHTTNGDPNKEYFQWAINGWNTNYGHRYPMGKGAKPLYSFFDGYCYDYIDARKHIYLPIYKKCAETTDAYKKLKKLHSQGVDLVLWDFDGRHTTQTMDVVLNDPSKPCGHGFVLKMMLEDLI